MKQEIDKLNTDAVYMVKDGSGTDVVPDGYMGLYYHVNFNNSRVGNVLVVPPGISLDEATLSSYGFDVGKINGVSSVVNKTNQEVSLISGQYLDGEILPVPANTNVSSLINFPLGAGTWNDSTRSVVSLPVTPVNIALTINLEQEVVIAQNETYFTYISIKNNSDTYIRGLSVESKSANENIMRIVNYTLLTDIPGNATVSERIPLFGVSPGTTTLTCRIKTPTEIVNTGDNVVTASVSVTIVRELAVKQELLAHWKPVWDKPDYLYSYRLVMSSESSRVKTWRLSFLLPEGAKISEDWLSANSSWISLNKDRSTYGMVVLDSIKGHAIEPSTDIPLDIQIIYPGEADSYNTLRNVRLDQLS